MLFVSKTSFVVRDSGDELPVMLGVDGAVDAALWGDITFVRRKPWHPAWHATWCRSSMDVRG